MRRKDMTPARRIMFATAIALLAVMSPGQAPAQDAAQSPSTDPQSLPRLELSDAQKQTIYTSIVNLNLKNESVSGFQPIPGAVVPEQIKLEPMPKTIVEHMPATAGYEIARVSNQGIVVDPKTRRVVDVIAGEKK